MVGVNAFHCWSTERLIGCIYFSAGRRVARGIAALTLRECATADLALSNVSRVCPVQTTAAVKPNVAVKLAW